MSFMIQYAYPLSETDRSVLTLLYQPIIKKEALSVFMTLSSLYHSGVKSPNLTDLYDVCGLNPESFEIAINKCEAAFLVSSDEKKKTITLHPVMSAQAFMDSPLLAHLKTHVSNDYLTRLKSKLLPPLNLVHPNIDAFKSHFGKLQEAPSWLENIRASIDVDSLINDLPKALVDRVNNIEDLKKMVHHVAYLYDLDTVQLNALMVLFLKQEIHTFEKLSDLAYEQYATNPSHKAYDLDYFKKVHPKDLLKDLTGSHVPASDIKIVDMLIQNSGLKLEVINVMMAYVMTELNGKMPVYKYFEKVSGQWHRNQIQTAEAAIAHIKITKQSKKKAPKKGSDIAWFDDYLKTKEA